MDDYKEIAVQEFPKYQHLLKWHDTQLRDRIYQISGGKNSLPNGYLLGVLYELYLKAWKGFEIEKSENGIDGFKRYFNTCSKNFLSDINRWFLDKDREQSALKKKQMALNPRRRASAGSVSQMGEEVEIAEEEFKSFDMDTWKYYMEGIDYLTERILRYRFIDGMPYTEIGRIENMTKEHAREFAVSGIREIRRNLEIKGF